MIRGLTTAAAGMNTDERMQQLLANNLANARTPGFKQSLAEAVEMPVRAQYRENYGNGPGKYIGMMGSGVVFQEGVPNFAKGVMQKTGRGLDVGLADTLPSGTYAAVQGANGQAGPKQGNVVVGANNRLSVGGQPLTVFGANGQAVTGIYAVRNPNYKGTALTSSAGSPDYDAAGNPSYLFANAAGQVVNPPITAGGGSPYAIRVGNQADMGRHSFYPVAYTSTQGAKGIAVTRDGAFQLDANNNLVDSAGHRILPVGANGQIIQGGRITMNQNYAGSSVFNSDGTPRTDSAGQPAFRVYNAAGAVVQGGRLGTVDANVTQISPLGATEFMVGNSLTAANVTPLLTTGTAQMNPGHLESSNAKPASVISQMLAVTNSYQANSRVIQTEDNLLNVAANQIGKVTGG